MPDTVKRYAHDTRNALNAGLDGVETHAANGYLLDQFLNTSSNHRSGGYGGPVENRARLLIEMVEAVCKIWRPQRVGARLSLLGTFTAMGGDDPEKRFGHVAEPLNRFNLAYLHIIEPQIARDATSEDFDPRGPAIMKLIRDRYRGMLIVCGGYDYAKAAMCLDQRVDL